MSEQRALTWSGKWHIVNPHHSESQRYDVALCGNYVYRDSDPRYPAHLRRIQAGTKKSTGTCKSCTRSAGVKTVTVELPAWDSPGTWPVARNVSSPSEARALAADLLAAAEAVSR